MKEPNKRPSGVKTRSKTGSSSFGAGFLEQDKNDSLAQKILQESKDKVIENQKKTQKNQVETNERQKENQTHFEAEKDQPEYHQGHLGECCKSTTDAKHICNDCIQKLLNHHEAICSKVRNGECPSWRHDAYKKGGKARRNLTFQIHSMRVFSDASHLVAEEWLRSKFCRNGNQKALDYCLRVLQMELFIRIFMDFSACSYKEAEEKMISNA